MTAEPIQTQNPPDLYAQYEQLLDEELLDKLRDDLDLLTEVLFKRYFGKLKSYVERRFPGTKTSAPARGSEDIANRSLFQAFDVIKRRGLDNRKDAFFWNLLIEIAIKRCIDDDRRQKTKKRGGGARHSSIESGNSQNDGENDRQIQIKDHRPGPEEDFGNQERRIAIRIAIQDCMIHLTVNESRVLALRNQSEPKLSFEDIGRQLGITSANARMLEFRSKRKMEHCLKEKGIAPSK